VGGAAPGRHVRGQTELVEVFGDRQRVPHASKDSPRRSRRSKDFRRFARLQVEAPRAAHEIPASPRSPR
jgi:hypothetical protein